MEDDAVEEEEDAKDRCIENVLNLHNDCFVI